MKKNIKIKFTGFWAGFDEQRNFFTEVLEKHYRVEISDAPDYIFCSVLGTPYEECNYEGIRIHFNGENYTPDFNIHDYGISYNNLKLEDRHLQFPLYLVPKKPLLLVSQKHLNVDVELLRSKSYFCNFVYGVSRDYREQAFEKFNTYKPVMSPGTGKNNMPNHPFVKTLDEKLDFLGKCKFTIAFDSTSLPGFATEKIMHAFAAQTIPIYFGDPKIGEHFNKKAFIDVADYDFDLDKVLERIKEIDQNDELYLSILREPVFKDENYIAKKQEEFEAFLVHIFSQDTDKAFRRSRIAGPKFHNDRLKEFSQLFKSKWFMFFKKLITKF